MISPAWLRIEFIEDEGHWYHKGVALSAGDDVTKDLSRF